MFRPHSARILFGLPILLNVYGCSARSETNIPEAQQIWSVVLSRDAFDFSNTSSDFSATRKAIIAGDRVVVIFEIGRPSFQNGRPMCTNRLLSLDLKSGAVVNQKDIVDYRSPDLYVTNDDHVVMGEFSLTRLNPDLTETEIHFEEKGYGRTIQMSPDGSTLAHENDAGNRTAYFTNIEAYRNSISRVRADSGKYSSCFD